MIFNSLPTYLKKGPLLVKFALQSQSRSEKNHHSSRRQQDTHVTITKASTVHLDHNIFSKRDWRRSRLLDHSRFPITVSLIRPGRTSHCSNNNKLLDIHSEVSANTRSYLPFKYGWKIVSNFCGFSFKGKV